MSSTITFLSRLASTPMTSLLRGRLAPSKQQLRDQLLTSGLPEPTRQLIGTVVKQAKLWRIEQADVQAELIAHFRDGIDAGATPDDLMKKFGDAETAAKLIRRAKIRNRPIAWHAKRFAIRAAVVCVAVYAVLFVRFLMNRPSVSVDYTAQLNAAILAVPEDQRAWPLYRELIPQMESLEKQRDAVVHSGAVADFDDVFDARPGDPLFATLTQYVERNRTVIDKVAKATRYLDMGFVYGPQGSVYEPGNPFNFQAKPGNMGVESWNDELNELMGHSLISILLPHLQEMRPMAALLMADAKVAASQRDGARYVERFIDVMNLDRQLRRQAFLVSQLVGYGQATRAIQQLKLQLAADPSLFTDEQLVALAHAMPAGRLASDVFNLDSEHVGFRDILQRTYTDDGNGDGRPSRYAVQISRIVANDDKDGGTGVGQFAAAAVPWGMASRRELATRHAELVAIMERCLRTPNRHLAKITTVDQVVQAMNADPVTRFRYGPILQLIPSTTSLNRTAERGFAQRDAVLIAIACELHKRKAGTFPKTLDEVVPALLPSVPIDPIDGLPLRYAVRDGRPFIYSVGADGDDDGGRLARKTRETPYASNNGAGNFGNNGIDADWILFPEPPAEQQTVAATQPGQ